jgi:broad specificity phosphatase PhoE
MKIYFVRHGEAAHNASFLIRQSESAYTDPAHRDAPLTSRGRMEVQQLADRLAHEVHHWD